jgi:hypothetical protein
LTEKLTIFFRDKDAPASGVELSLIGDLLCRNGRWKDQIVGLNIAARSPEII